MKRITIIFSIFVALLIQFSCTQSTVIDTGFKDQIKFSIYDYIVDNPTEYSSFQRILVVADLDKTLSAYNPGGKTNGFGYTLFLPTNAAVDNFVKASGKYASLDDMLKDVAYVRALARYHVLNQQVFSGDFPFGAFTQPTLSNDYLNVAFDVRPDTTYYKINNQGSVIKANIKASNGYIQVIGTMLSPITQNSYNWLKSTAGFSIFCAAMDKTGLDKIINVDMKLPNQPLGQFTMLVEPDSIFNKRGIKSFDDLALLVSPGRTDYLSKSNPLNTFVFYHVITESLFMDKLTKNEAQNYSTMADVPIYINGVTEGTDITINKGRETFVSDKGVITDFIGILYDQSNVNTQSGAIHFVNQIMNPVLATPKRVNFEFWEENFLTQYRNVNASDSYLFEDHALLNRVTWSGAPLSYIKSIDPTEAAWNKDWFQIDGDFIITYNVPGFVEGKYDFYLRADCFSADNAVIEVSIDGVKVGGLIDLSKGGNASNPWYEIPVGSVTFTKYAGHTIQVKSMIPGIFKWDSVFFDIPKN